MKTLACTVSDDIFTRFPGYLRGVVVVEGASNHPAPDELVGLLRETEAGLRQRLSLEKITEEPRIKAWREAYRAFGAKPSEFRSSIEALARRVLHGDPLPAINALVDIGTLVSLRYLLPVGGHAFDALEDDLVLRLASGKETFIPFGGDQVEHPLPGEVIFTEGNTVLTRRWTWRQSTRSLTELDTRDVVMLVNSLPPVGWAEVAQACQETAGLVQRFCGGSSRVEILSTENPRLVLR